MFGWLLGLGILFIFIAVIFVILGFIGRIAWAMGKWLIIVFLILAIIFLVL